MKKTVLLFVVWMAQLFLAAQPLCRITQYDEEDGVPSNHITQMLQDGNGFMWFSTWNGLCRFDGYEFETFKPEAGDGCHMATDRLRDISLQPDGNILCREDDDYYLFDLSQYRFRDLTGEEAQHADDDIKQYRQSFSLYHNTAALPLQVSNQLPAQSLTFGLHDHQGNQWLLGVNTIYKIISDTLRTQRLDISPAAQVKCLFRDNLGRCWLTTREDGAIRVYTSDLQLIGYLGNDGRLHATYTSFGSAIYCMYQSDDGTLWLGSKPDGVFRLRETADGQFNVEHLTDLPGQEVYDLLEDRYGRLWIATMSGGLYYTADPQATAPRFATPRNYPHDSGQRVRYLHITRHGVLLAAATDGLIVADLKADADKMEFQLHQRESDRVESLSSSATMDILEDNEGRIFISTESGGMNQTDHPDLLSSQLAFTHLNTANHRLPSDCVMSLAPMPNGSTMIVSAHLIALLDSSHHVRVLDARYFNENYHFSEAHPLLLDDGRWLFGLDDGAFTTTMTQMYHQTTMPPIVLTRISIQGGQNNWAAENLDTLTLQSHERSLTIHFAALDYSAPERISYAFRLNTGDEADSTQWNFIGHNRSATLLDLEPGTYHMEIRSTNADGEWSSQPRRLVIIVTPTFWEAWYGQLLIVLLIAGVLTAVSRTLLYIRRIKRQQRETLAKYLELIEHSNEPQKQEAHSQDEAQPDPMLERVMKFIEDHLSDSDVNVGDMAAAAASSRSGLQRKLKQTMGITPQDLLREARIKHACQLLGNTQKSIAEVAYACGFTDPKYFSRCFKQSTGQSPSEFKNAH